MDFGDNIYQAKTTKFFGDIVDNIYQHVGKEASKILYHIHLELSYTTPSDTGTLRANWHHGIRPNSNFIPRVKDASIPRPDVKFKNYGFNHAYYLWNNSPYITYVNDGIAGKAGQTAKSSANQYFIQKAIAKGIKNAESS